MFYYCMMLPDHSQFFWLAPWARFKGLYPSGAAIISGNGPYQSVEDVYNLRGIKDNDIMKARTTDLGQVMQK